MTPSWFFTANTIKHNCKPTATPPSTSIATADNHFLPPLDDDDGNDSDTADLMGKYDCRRKNTGKRGHCSRYTDNNKIEALHGLYEETKDDNHDDDGHDNGKDNGNWDDMEENEREEDEDDNDDVVDITAV